MPRYIDADKLHYKRVWIYDIQNGECRGTKSAVVVFADEIDKNKKARVDPDEVRGVGEWEDAKQHGMCRCSVCKDCYIEKDYITQAKWKYCPNCGARMKGASEDG